MVQIPDGPIVDSLNRYGVPPWQRNREEAICPVCHSYCSTIYKNGCGEIVGCDECVETYDAADVNECFPNEGREW